MSEVHSHGHTSDDGGAAQRKQIWKVFIILSVITAIEFIIAFTIGQGTFKIALFVGLTIVKAFFIVGEFMHLKHEVKSLIWSILIPCIFVVWLLLALMLEGGSIFSLR